MRFLKKWFKRSPKRESRADLLCERDHLLFVVAEHRKITKYFMDKEAGLQTAVKLAVDQRNKLEEKLLEKTELLDTIALYTEITRMDKNRAVFTLEMPIEEVERARRYSTLRDTIVKKFTNDIINYGIEASEHGIKATFFSTE